VNVSFLFQGGIDHRFALKRERERNGFPFEISMDYPFPQPLNVTHVLNFSSPQNILDLKRVSNGIPMIALREYQFVGIQACVDQICGRAVDLATETVMAQSPACDHADGFDLVACLSVGLAIGRMSCPVCRREFDIASLVPAARQSASTTVPFFQREAEGVFWAHGDWFDF
jgi:hypothetical protein